MNDLDKLTPDERKIWDEFHKWYLDNGWLDPDASHNAWMDMEEVHGVDTDSRPTPPPQLNLPLR